LDRWERQTKAARAEDATALARLREESLAKDAAHERAREAWEDSTKALNEELGQLKERSSSQRAELAHLKEAVKRNAIIIDCGAAQAETVLAVLRRFQIDTICRLVVTHSHDDHSRGAAAVLTAFQGRIEELWMLDDVRRPTSVFWQRVLEELRATRLDRRQIRLLVRENRPKEVYRNDGVLLRAHDAELLDGEVWRVGMRLVHTDYEDVSSGGCVEASGERSRGVAADRGTGGETQGKREEGSVMNADEEPADGFAPDKPRGGRKCSQCDGENLYSLPGKPLEPCPQCVDGIVPHEVDANSEPADGYAPMHDHGGEGG
jgi:hypothetical protein